MSICAGSPATLSVASPQQGITYDWYDSSTKTNHLATGASYTTNPLNANQTFYIEASNAAGCTSATLAGVQVNVFNEPSSPIITGTTAVCNGTSATLSVQNPQAGLTYNWYSAQSGGTAVFSGTTFITSAVTGNITYYVDATNSGGCTSANRTAVNLTANAEPTVSASGVSICPGTKATLLAITKDNNANINWYTAASGGNSIFTGAFFTTPALNANTIYYAEAVDNVTGCISATRAAVQVQMIQPLAAPQVTVNSTTVSSVTFQWSAVTGATGYKVSIDNGQTFTDPSSGNDGLTHTVSGLQGQQAVTIIVKATGNSPCAESASSVAITGTTASPLDDQIFVANAFTPNGDGKNDIVYVRGPNIRGIKFYVYDQWGELIYSTVNPASGWDGTYKGSKEPVGVYVYYVEAVMNDGSQVNKKGSITLLR
jgi:gliding motility-associated-like protein